jgi:hypothetical protein
MSGRSSWDLGGVGLAGSPFFRIREQQNLTIYAQLRESIPLVDAAVQKIKQFVGCPLIEAADTTKAQIEGWMSTVVAGRVQTGFENWFSTYLDDMLTYGRTHTEMVPNRARNDIYALVPLPVPTIHLRPNADGISLDLVQDFAIRGNLDPLPPELMVSGYHDVRGDDPYGRSLLYGIPFIGEIYTGMVKALGETWARMGAPSYQVHVQFPTGFDDPQGTKSAEVRQVIQSGWEQAMLSRKNSEIRDFFSTASADGDVRVTIIGAEGEVLDFAVPSTELMQQIQAKFHLPPMLYGLAWSSTERMSAVQASMLTQSILHIRGECQSVLLDLLKKRQRFAGGSQKLTLKWPEISIMEAFESARADLMEAQARSVRLDYEVDLWRLGVQNQYEVARQSREELADLTNAEIDAYLAAEGGPGLATEPPLLSPLDPLGAEGGAGGSPMAENGPPLSPVGRALNGNGRRH